MTQVSHIEKEMPKAYNPQEVEGKWYEFWMEQGYFKPKIDHTKKPFTIIMPPPNVTGDLHLGHALTDALEDIMIRWHRMKGEPTLWLPGVDHAAIAAQVVVERLLASEGTNRHELGREKFAERIWDWTVNCRRNITMQHRRLGASCDWSRERFTLDDGPSLAVRTAFVRLYQKGLIYKGRRIINWCPRCTTALSDLEVDHQDVTGELYYIRYHIADSDDFITVATTRPETLLGDTAVAVHPEDERFRGMVGKKAVIPFVNRVVPIVADEVVASEFGTGAVKVTPAHDPVDFEIAGRQNLPSVNILNPDGSMNENAGPYQGLNRFDCRKKIIVDLKKEGLLVKTEPYSHSVGHCDRCHVTVEPIASEQWFVRMEPLAKPTIREVVEGRVKIIPERFTRIYMDWLENIRDWCISRQLWWGHRIPVWYCPDCKEVIAAVETPASCPKCGSPKIYQDPDVLDTWFSSGLWPHSTLGWPGDTEDYRYFYPTSVMETGYDILFFWIARMIMMGLEDTGQIPFHTVYLHGLVRDEKGEKMSKTRGNVVNPIDTLEKYGTDALRFALTTGTAPGNDIKISPSRLEAGRNFANKLWNATRFVLSSIEPGIETEIKDDLLPAEDRWILSRLNRIIDSVNNLMAEYEFGEAQKQLYDFLWGEFCDWYIEIAKIRLRSGEEGAPSPIPVLVRVLDVSLRLLHPYMPFLTEELWQHLPQDLRKAESIMIAPYPDADITMIDDEAERTIASVIEIVHAIRNARAEYKLASTKWIPAEIYSGDMTDTIKPYTGVIETLSRAKPVTLFSRRREGKSGDNALVLLLKDADIVIPMESMVDIAAEKKRLQKDIDTTQAEVARLGKQLSDHAFLTRAPAAIVAKEREKLATLADKLGRLEQELGKLA
ncbi:MAG: valine--tRNA ligase [Chloroflexota bacterium]